MARDYKHRANKTSQGTRRQPANANKRRPAPRAKSASNEAGIPLWRWVLVLGVVGLFAYFLYSLSLTPEQDKPARLTKSLARPVIKTTPKKVPKAVKSAKKTPAKHDIQYDFYTILPEAEFVIPDHEVKTRKREERVGKAKSGVQYSVQAGAFRKHKDADSLKAKLLMMGFSPKIEKAIIGTATWYRVKMGPYNRLASVDAIQSRLKSNKMDALVIEVKK
ncbi:MAG: SPOR domain-containing protein [Gammaproteobacteria bacterium]|jgi:cell division protein FtsN|nr:SPOR domain-containing protein [Gammaproteobacteria bacterium]MBT4146581.1 SPOR domain-containing protein [Gammaproteobacteria bacterium]MBT5222720.1 SPOR domain-containing protein [Gammaproteobacteria bacterium]MBT5827107.1 SPOR domain-containing protein [Gammaproteobacteria bacterium]MBT6420352.1 SPOR domain-containing protein [Gammaproteobacteria bacterium]